MERLNRLTEKELKAALTRCCGATRWVDGMVALRPIHTAIDLHAKAKSVYRDLETAEIAYSAIQEADKVHYIQYIKEQPSKEARNAEMAVLTGNYQV